MTSKEAAIVTAYTGIFIGDFSVFHEYIEKLLGEPVFIHQLADKEMMERIKQAAKKDFMNIKVEDINVY